LDGPAAPAVATVAAPQSFHLDPKVYFRAGKTRDWEQHLSALAVEAIDQKTRERGVEVWTRRHSTASGRSSSSAQL
jgi:hypothetical protein